MKRLLFLIVASVAALCGAAQYLYPQPVPVWAEETTRERQIMAVSVNVDQCSLMKLADGTLSARAVCSVSDGTNTFKRVIMTNQAQFAAVIGAEQTAQLAAQLDMIFAAILAAENN
jgi:hypothetical protein